MHLHGAVRGFGPSLSDVPEKTIGWYQLAHAPTMVSILPTSITSSADHSHNAV